MLDTDMVDSHFHLFHMKKVGMDYMDIIKTCFEDGLAYAVDIGITPDNFSERIKTASSLKGLYTAHGYYPSQCTSENLKSELEYLETTLIQDKKAVAVGEMGFDFFHDYGDVELQAELIKKQIEIANRLVLPVIIHSRDAEQETLDFLKRHTPEAGGVIHCFSYTPETALKFIEMGFYISFAGNVTYKKAENIQEAAKTVPLDRLLIETDAPYLSPQKVRNKKNHPGHIGYTYEYISGLREMEPSNLIPAVKENFMRLFRISDMN